MVSDIDQKLFEMNEKMNYSDSNLVAKNIESLSQKAKIDYIFRSFVVLNMILFTVMLAAEALIVECIVSLKETYQLDDSYIALFPLIYFALMIPEYIFHRDLFQKVKERKALLIVIVICLINSVLLMNLFEMHLSLYVFLSVLLLSCCGLTNNCVSALLSKIVPPDYKVFKKMSAGLVVAITYGLGRTAGCLMLFFTGQYGVKLMNFYTYLACAILYLISGIMTIAYYSDLRVKAIARILRKDTRKISMQQN